MRWLKKNPKIGDTRLRSGFLWIPRGTQAGEIRWLEFSRWMEIYADASGQVTVHEWRFQRWMS